MKKTFYSNGKLLITGEYTVLDGALAFALPTSYGQYLETEESPGGMIRWTSLDADGSTWFQSELPLQAIFENRQDGTPQINILIGILHEAHKANPAVLGTAAGFTVTTRLTFPRNWGLGSSSTLINNIAQWFGIDAFRLLADSFGGSGYDIACAQNNTPVFYRLENGAPIVQTVSFDPSYADNLYFIYLNRKQDSRQAIYAYRARRNDIAPVVGQISHLSSTLPGARDTATFAKILKQHETIMSGILNMPAVQEALFPDFDGTVKSLGAWGGDFIIAVSESDPTAYFRAKGFDVVIPYRDMILQS